MTETIGFLQFAEQQGTSFHLTTSDDKMVRLVLRETVERDQDPRYEEFSLFFQGPLQPLLAQGTYEMTHDALGVQAIFITPIAQDPQGYTYQAVFNRLQESQP